MRGRGRRLNARKVEEDEVGVALVAPLEVEAEAAELRDPLVDVVEARGDLRDLWVERLSEVGRRGRFWTIFGMLSGRPRKLPRETSTANRA